MREILLSKTGSWRPDISVLPSPLAVLPLETLVGLGHVGNGTLAAVAHDRRHQEFAVSGINFPFNDTTGPERDRVGFHETDVGIIGAPAFHSLVSPVTGLANKL